MGISWDINNQQNVSCRKYRTVHLGVTLCHIRGFPENSDASHPGNEDLSLPYWRNPPDIEVHPIDPIRVAILLSSPVIQLASRNDGNTTTLLPVLMRKSSRSGYFYDVSSIFLRDLIWWMMHQPSYKSKLSFCGQLQLLPICHPSGSKGQFRRPAGKRRCASWGLDHRIGSWSLTPQWLKCRAAWTPKSLVLGGALLNYGGSAKCSPSTSSSNYHMRHRRRSG